jgi:hypothetical protein
VTIHAVILASVTILPRDQITLANLRPELEHPKLLLRKEATETGVLEISDLVASVPWIAARATRLDEGRPGGDGLPPGAPGDWLIELEVDGEAVWGYSKESLRFRTGLSRQPLIELPISVNLLPPVNLSTERLTLPARGDGAPSEGLVHLTVRRGLDPAGLTLDTEPESLDATLEHVDGRHYKVVVRWDGAETGDGSLVFRVGEMEQRLPVARQPGS